MDTRIKIIDEARAASIADSGATVVSGTFDPLLAATAARLAEIKREVKDGNVPLLVLISPSPDAIFPVSARAELVAGLAVVDYVCETLGTLTPDLRLETEHCHSLEQLIERVHARQQAAS